MLEIKKEKKEVSKILIHHYHLDNSVVLHLSTILGMVYRKKYLPL